MTVFLFECFLLAFQQSLKDVIDHKLRSGLRHDGKFFGVRSAENDLHYHLSISVAGKASILHSVSALSFELLQRGGPLRVSLLQIREDLFQSQRLRLGRVSLY